MRVNLKIERDSYGGGTTIRVIIGAGVIVTRMEVTYD
jgi:hypothetical protein